jgi:hypothetical protein
MAVSEVVSIAEGARGLDAAAQLDLQRFVIDRLRATIVELEHEVFGLREVIAAQAIAMFS